MWGPVEMKFGAGEPTAATAVWMFNDQHDDPDEVARKAWEQLLVKRGPEAVVRADREFGRYGLIGVTSMHPGARMGPQWMPTAAEDAARVLESGDVPSDGTNVTRLVHSLWLLMGQRIVTVADADVDRKTARRAARAGLPPRVTVVYLRQSKRSPGTGTGAPLTYRMMVGLATQGFWRHSRVGAAYPGAIEREPGVFVVKQWIMPYVRGPEGAPMHTPDHVYAIR